jgi:hypothetical protein
MNPENTNNEIHKAQLAAAVAADTASVMAVIQNDLGYIKRDISDIKGSIRDMGAIYVTQSQHSELISVTHDHEERMRLVESSRDNIIGGMKWAGALVTILLAVLGWIYISQLNSFRDYQLKQDNQIDNLIKQVNHIPQ